MPSAAVTAEVVSPERIPGAELDRLSSQAGMYFRRSRLEWLWEDPRWLDKLVAVRHRDRIVGLLPISTCLAPRWFDPLYDVAELTSDVRYTPSKTCLIAGRADVRGSMLFDPALDRDDLREVAQSAVRSACEFARREGRRCVALYILAEEAALSAALSGAGMNPRAAPGRQVIRWPEPTLDSYLACLSGSHRQVVRADWRTRDKLGLHTKFADWEGVISAAAPLINVSLVKHGYQSRSELVRMRLRQWKTVVGDDGFALCATASGKCTGYVFCWRDSDRVTVHDVAFEHGSSEIDCASYLELMVYGPLAACCDFGLSVLDLGIYAAGPKRLRGAVEEQTNLWIQDEDY